eukprot:scaffold4202_cov370-Prasinococcus_capsulatus_cf.AAC.2
MGSVGNHELQWARTNNTDRVAVPQRRRYGTTLMPIDLQVPIRDFTMPCMGTSTFISSSALTTAISYRARSDICGCSFPASFSLPAVTEAEEVRIARASDKTVGFVDQEAESRQAALLYARRSLDKESRRGRACLEGEGAILEGRERHRNGHVVLHRAAATKSACLARSAADF